MHTAYPNNNNGKKPETRLKMRLHENALKQILKLHISQWEIAIEEFELNSVAMQIWKSRVLACDYSMGHKFNGWHNVGNYKIH